eukprot:4145404-Alexandrium_andersonii.AAC.1
MDGTEWKRALSEHDTDTSCSLSLRSPRSAPVKDGVDPCILVMIRSVGRTLDLSSRKDKHVYTLERRRYLNDTRRRRQ